MLRKISVHNAYLNFKCWFFDIFKMRFIRIKLNDSNIVPPELLPENIKTTNALHYATSTSAIVLIDALRHALFSHFPTF